MERSLSDFNDGIFDIYFLQCVKYYEDNVRSERRRQWVQPEFSVLTVGHESLAPSAGHTAACLNNTTATSGRSHSSCGRFFLSLSSSPSWWGRQGLMRQLTAHKVVLSSFGHWRGEGLRCHPQLLRHIRKAFQNASCLMVFTAQSAQTTSQTIWTDGAWMKSQVTCRRCNPSLLVTYSHQTNWSKAVVVHIQQQRSFNNLLTGTI